MDAPAVVQSFRTAWEGRDFDQARRLLADDLDFNGPIDSFDNADDYIEAIKDLSRIVEGVETKRLFADQQEVCVIYDLQTVGSALAPVAEWYTVTDSKISSIRVFFDARAFAPSG